MSYAINVDWAATEEVAQVDERLAVKTSYDNRPVLYLLEGGPRIAVIAVLATVEVIETNSATQQLRILTEAGQVFTDWQTLARVTLARYRLTQGVHTHE